MTPIIAAMIAESSVSISIATVPWLAGPVITPTPLSPSAHRARSLAVGMRRRKRRCQFDRPSHWPAYQKPGRLVPGMIGIAAKPRSINRSLMAAYAPMACPSEWRFVVENFAAQGVLEAEHKAAQEFTPLAGIECRDVRSADFFEVIADQGTGLERGTELKLFEVGLRHGVDFLRGGVTPVIVAQPNDWPASAGVIAKP